MRAASIGFIFQTFNLIRTLSAQENVEAALVPLRVGTAQRQASRAAQALADVGLGDRLRHLPSELPGSQQQRGAIAGLVKEPTALLADEPTGNLTKAPRRDHHPAGGLWQELGLTLVLVTHDTAVTCPSRRRVGAGNRVSRV